jgi:acyl-CoA synthetase (AMP-forming)/AMP-acid ligase II
MTDWNFVDVWRAIAKTQPDHVAIEQGERRLTWSEFAKDIEGLGSYLHGLGLPAQSTVALYLYNCPEHLVGFGGALAAGHVPINTNYRYGDDELRYLFENGDTRVVVFHGAFVDQVRAVRDQLPALSCFLFVDDATSPCPEWATPLDAAIAASTVELPELSGDGLMMLYTGGTTGLPKGVMWRQDDLFVRLNGAGFLRYPEDATIEDVSLLIEQSGQHPSLLPACPLMHGTGLFTALRSLSEGGRVVLLTKRSFDAMELVTVLEERSVRGAVIVGDPFARPMLQVLREQPGRFPLASLQVIGSSGAMWSQEVKEGLLEVIPHVLLADAFASSEALGMGNSYSSRDALATTAEFRLGEHSRVVNDAGQSVIAGSDEIGQLILGGRNPLGYYKDPVKSAATFPVIDGVRYVVPGDMAKVAADGSIQLLGRGSQCINTAGEKVFPEEVEESLKTHPDVVDACVVGVKDDHFGQRVVAAVELHPGRHVSEHELIAHVKSRLASYKAPRAVRVVATIGRAVNGKMDYKRHQVEAAQWIDSLVQE